MLPESCKCVLLATDLNIIIFFKGLQSYTYWCSLIVVIKVRSIINQNKTESFFFFVDIHADIILSDTPQSRNVSAGTLVEFTCATPETGLTAFTLTTDITLGNTMSNDVILSNGERQLTLSFIAPPEHQMLTILCVATRVNNMGMVENFKTSVAILMIQGERFFKLN